MQVRRFVTFEVEIEVPDGTDVDETEVLIDELMEGAGFDFCYDNGDGTKTVGPPTLHSYTSEEPE